MSQQHATLTSGDFISLLEKFKQECEEKLSDKDSHIRDEVDVLFAKLPHEDVSSAAKLFLAANEGTFEQYVESAKQTSGRTICGELNSSSYYSCVTCRKHEATILCERCFQAGPHVDQKHDYHRVLGDGLTGCDCGYEAVLKSDSCCPHHGSSSKQASSGNHELLDKLLCSAGRIVPRLLTRIVTHCRSKSDVHQLADLCDVLASLSVTDEFVDLISTNLRDHDLYKANVSTNNDAAAVQLELQSLIPKHERYQAHFSISHSCLLDELVFWLLRLHFPKSLHVLLVSFLSNRNCRETCARAFSRHYALFPILYSTLYKIDAEAKVALLHASFSTNLLKDKTIAMQLCEEENFAERNIAAFRVLLEYSDSLVPSKLVSTDSNLRTVSGNLLQNYGAFAYDLVTLLEHSEAALFVLHQHDLFTALVQNVAYFQAAIVLQRATSGAAQDRDVSHNMINGELGFCYRPLLCIVSAILRHHVQDGRKQAKNALNALKMVSRTLHEWLKSVGVPCDRAPEPECGVLTDQSTLTFHLPLQRYFAAFLAVTLRLQVQTQRATRQLQITVHPALCYYVVQHVLDLLSGQFQIACGRGQWSTGRSVSVLYSHYYRKLRLVSSYTDLDWFLAQFCAAQMDADLYLNLAIHKFCVRPVLSFSTHQQQEQVQEEQQHDETMLESFYLLLVQHATGPAPRLVANAQETGRELRSQVIALLSVRDMSQTEILNLLPEGTKQAVVLALLSDVATRTSHDVNSKFVLQAKLWYSEYDPVGTYLLCGREAYMKSTERCRTRINSGGTFTNWTQFRAPLRNELQCYLPFDRSRFLRSSSFYAIVFCTLDHAVDWSANANSMSMTPYLAVHLLRVALSYREYTGKCERLDLDAEYEPTSADVLDLQLGNWYPPAIVNDPFMITKQKYAPTPAPSQCDARVSSSDSLFATGTDVASLLNFLSRRSTFIANSLRANEA